MLPVLKQLSVAEGGGRRQAIQPAADRVRPCRFCGPVRCCAAAREGEGPARRTDRTGEVR